MASDEELLELWGNGDAVAGEKLFERHFEPLCWFFRSKAPDHVQELVQETLLACVQVRDSDDLQVGFRAFLFAVARNKLVDHYRRERRGETPFDPAAVSVQDVVPSPSGLIARNDEQRRMLHLLRTMPMDTQILLELFYWEDMTGPEIAVALGVPEGTIRTRLRKARTELRAAMDKLPQREEPA